VLAVGVLWSNVLAYQDASLAPRGELSELQRIGEKITGQGPTLMTDDQIYGARHFLRDADPEGVSQLRRRSITLANGETADRAIPGGTDEIALPDVLGYRTIVTRRSPAESRPPSPYALIYSGTYHDVWQRPVAPLTTVLQHLALGTATDAGSVPDCAEVQRLAQAATPGGRIVAAPAIATAVVQLDQTDHPDSWEVAGPRYLQPGDDPGTITADVTTTASGLQQIWLGGSVRGKMTLSVDGHTVGSVRGRLLSDVGYTLLGSTELSRGPHRVTLHYGGEDWHPGSALSKVLGLPIGPLVLAPDTSSLGLTSVSPSLATELCGKRWDWIEAVRP
jgi:hypothetical protein